MAQQELKLPLVYVMAGPYRRLPETRALSSPRHVALHANASFFASALEPDGEGAYIEDLLRAD